MSNPVTNNSNSDSDNNSNSNDNDGDDQFDTNAGHAGDDT